MNIQELQEKIIQLKKEKDVCILAHAYQSQDIWEVADYVGDSYGLAVQAAKDPHQNIVMCGVRFMAETCKVLSPEKNVVLANSLAACPMAAQMNRQDLIELKKKYPDYTVVAYINTTADFKREVDMIVTSSSAVKIIKKMDADKILFVPDCHLGTWVAKQVPEKTFKFFNGGCPTHCRMTAEDVKRARAEHPDAEILVHPECLTEVSEQADYIGSTTGIMKYAADSDSKEFVIGTENSIVQHLQFAHPEKRFYPLSKMCVCMNMKATTLMDVYHSLNGDGGEQIELPEQTIEESRAAIDRMVEFGQ
ncbi:MAG: quinolinate synthase NadA [Pseudoramibacter sp. EUB1.1]|uniref:Quinolinate synthase n=1 Tax=Candidatus Pseudoramibacter fermentans TaxID=2594427 RepID=A0A6L5GS70_9FIRM|nr:quinolinate synthase NadA [Candidatus Pseudoramibacter fermentans]